jgi:hypothetical protein
LLPIEGIKRDRKVMGVEDVERAAIIRKGVKRAAERREG